MEYIDRIVDLGLPISKDTLILLQKQYVLAGGSVAYSICDYIPLASVGDIDIFVTNCEDNEDCRREFNNIYNLITVDGFNSHIFEIRGITFGEYVPVVNFHSDKANLDVQIIFTDFKDSIDVIKDFDLDYVQCAIHDDKLFITDDCKRSHSERKVLSCIDLNKIRPKRLTKALFKGFNVPYFGFVENASCSNNSPIKYDIDKILPKLNPKFRGYLERDQCTDRVNLNTLRLVSLNDDLMVNKIKKSPIFKNFNFINFVLKDNLGTYQVPIISVIIEVLEYDEYELTIKTHPLLGNKITTNDKFKTYIMEKGCLGEMVVLIKVYSNYDEVKYKVIDIWKDEGDLEGCYIKIDINTNENNSSIVTANMIKDPYYKIKLLIDKYAKTNNDLEFIKLNAYRCFLYHISQGETLEKSISKACGQMDYDYNKKIRKNLDPWLMLSISFYNREISTVQQMINFIEGYH